MRQGLSPISRKDTFGIAAWSATGKVSKDLPGEDKGRAKAYAKLASLANELAPESHSVIEHIPDPEAALTELARVLHNDGVLILGHPLEIGFFVSLERIIRIEKRAYACSFKVNRCREGKPSHVMSQIVECSKQA